MQPPLTDSYYLAIGKVTASFSLLERQIEFFCWASISKDQSLGHIVTAELSFRNLVALASALFRYRVGDEKQRQEFETLLSRAVRVEEKRNTITHSLWTVSENPQAIFRVKHTAKKGKGFLRHSEETSAQDIETVAAEISGVVRALVDFQWNLAPVAIE
jgi:hypothetical protein